MINASNTEKVEKEIRLKKRMILQIINKSDSGLNKGGENSLPSKGTTITTTTISIPPYCTISSLEE